MERTPGYAFIRTGHTPWPPEGSTRGFPFKYIRKIYVLHSLIHLSSLDYPDRLPSLLNTTPMTDSNLPRIPDSIDSQRLQAMQLVAKMKESADKYGIGFVGGFIAPNGEKFVMSNMDDDDTQMLLPEDLQ
jgi:hypothetical protein